MNANTASAASAAPALHSSISAPESTDERNRIRVQGPERVRARVTTLETFDAYRVSLEAARACADIAKTLNANLRDQLSRASSSVVLNIAEGFGSRSRGVKRRHYEIANGSATECIAILDLASALGVAEGPRTNAARMLLTRVVMMLAKLGARLSCRF